MIDAVVRPGRRWVVGAAAVLLVGATVAFAIWCVHLIRTVHELRDDVEQRVGWLQTIHRVQTAADEGPAVLDSALAELRPHRAALEAAGRDDASIRIATAAAFGVLEQRSADSLEIREAVGSLVPPIRGQTASISRRLGGLWDSLYLLVGVALTLAATTIGLFFYAWFVTVARSRAEVARLEGQLLQADRLAALGTLAAGVAHEINNPLAYVVTNLDLLREQVRTTGLRAPAGEDAGELVDEALRGARRVAVIVRDLKSFSHPGPTAACAVSVNEAIEVGLQLARGDLRRRAQLACKLRELPPVRASENQLVQVFVNLIVNAVQALGPGDPGEHLISIETRRDGDWVEITIDDTGMGIDPEIRQRLFEPFVTSKDVGEGTGLGLFVCRGVVERMGGTIGLEARAEGGTRATVRLPAAPGASPQSRSSSEVPIRGANKLRILLIDDEKMLTNALARMMRGDDVSIAADGKQGLRKLRDRSFDVVLCDLMMPGMSGMDLFAAVSEQDPELAQRFVFMSGGTFAGPAREFMDRVRNPVLEKPFSRAELHEVLARFREPPPPDPESQLG